MGPMLSEVLDTSYCGIVIGKPANSIPRSSVIEDVDWTQERRLEVLASSWIDPEADGMVPCGGWAAASGRHAPTARGIRRGAHQATARKSTTRRFSWQEMAGNSEFLPP